MGFNSGGGQKTYLKISDGKIALRVQEGSDGAIKCTNKDQSKVWYEKRYHSFTGKIVNVFKKESEYNGKKIYSLCLDMEDKLDLYQLEMPWSSGYSKGFFMAMPNINFDYEVTVTPWMKEVNNKKKTSLYITNYNEKENVKWFWSKEDPKDLPQMEKVLFKGEEVWDDSKQQAYFEKYLNDNIKPKLQNAEAIKPNESSNSFIPDEKVDNDDMPF